MDVLDEYEPIHSSEYLLKLANEPIVTANKKSLDKPKEEPHLSMDSYSPESDVDWSPVTQTLQGIIFNI